MAFEVKLTSSLAKVFPDKAPENVIRKAAALRGERFSFQAAFFSSDYWLDVEVTIDSPLKDFASLRQVDLVPVDVFPFCKDNKLDDDALLTAPGLAPDVLRPLWNNCVMTATNQWRSVWVTVNVPVDFAAGKYPVKLIFTAVYPDGKRKRLTTAALPLEIIDAVLPEQKLMVSHWFHGDCLAVCYKEEVFSERHWEICRKFIRNAVEHGMNMLLTPIFTPPLDTQVGGERPTIQLVRIKRDGGRYSFDFSLLDRWISMAQECGIKYFEMAHLFTQWGAKCTPKIVAETGNGMEKIFGWDVKAASPEYRDFLDQFLPALTGHLRKIGVAENCVFHCSDEPRFSMLKDYKYASTLIRKYLKGFKLVDALSNPDFYELGLVDTPIVCEDHFNLFDKFDLAERWIYYCCTPANDYPNRFIHFPSARNRVMGILMYHLGANGFLHWGFNFYYTRSSRYPVSPYGDTTCGHAFPGGDAFLVYPGDDYGPLDSLRHEVFFEALQDMRLLQLLEKFYDRKFLLRTLNKFAKGKTMTVLDYPRDEKSLLKVREKLNSLLRAAVSR
ncbi:MAG: DUF4091 domain-containing protein [Lentisphaerae bacterium]|nr:DUF4091 domain-containing protein [Lentisphaerota bacterium]